MNPTEENMEERAMEVLADYLRSHHMRRTPERAAIVHQVFATEGHFYADSLYEALRQQDFQVSLGTVYTTLSLLEEAGLLRVHHIGTQPAQYERAILATQEMIHLVCTQCGRVRSVRDPEVEQLLIGRRFSTFQVKFVAVYVNGLCLRCQKRLRRRKNP